MKALIIFVTVMVQVSVFSLGVIAQQSSGTSAQQASQPAKQPSAPSGTADAKVCDLSSQKAPPKESEPIAAQNNQALEKVLHRMDQTAADFRTAQADFIWKAYTSVVSSFSDPEQGKVYFRRSGSGTEMGAEIFPPSARQIVFANGKVQVYTPGTNELRVYDASAHRDEVEAFLVLGFGSSGSDLRKTFDVTYQGQEKIGGVETAKLDLVPKSTSVKNQFPKIDLWIDPQRGVSLRQQLFEGTDGDCRLADYSNIKLNDKLPRDAFKLKTSGKPKTVNH
jgi:outer membrane lipoprotein-sorting protein